MLCHYKGGFLAFYYLCQNRKVLNKSNLPFKGYLLLDVFASIEIFTYYICIIILVFVLNTERKGLTSNF